MNFDYLYNINMNSELKFNLVNKITNLQEIVKNIIRKNQLYKTTGFLEINDLNSCVIFAESIYLNLRNLMNKINDNEDNEDRYIGSLQDIIGEISTLISLYGCDTLNNLVTVCIGIKYKIEEKY